jgi:hypothetical protein
LSASCLQSPKLHQKILRDQFIDNIGDGLRSQMRQTGDMHATDRAMTSNDIQNDTPIMVPDSLRIFTKSDRLRVRMRYSW